MASKYWIKLYHEILDDPKMGRLSDRLWRRTIELFLIAGDHEQDGELPAVGDMAWRLRVSDEELAADLVELERIGIVAQNGATHIVMNFVKRQAANSSAERVRRYRDRNRTTNDNVTETVTTRNTDIDTDIDIDTEEDKEKNIADSAAINALFDTWAQLFPTKPQPRRTTKSLLAHITARLKEPDFNAGWYTALERVKDSEFCLTGGWFDLSWFVRNDEHWQRCLNGNYDNKRNGNGRNGGNGSKPPAAIRPAGLSEDDWAALQYVQYNHDEDAATYRAELEAKGVKVNEWLSTIS